MKYTKDHVKKNRITISTPTLELFRKVTKIFKVAGILRPYHWKHYKENTGIVFVKDYKGEIWTPCFDNITKETLDVITAYQFFIDNNMIIENYEIY